MALRCPKCSQLLAADVPTCPLCGSPLSSELINSTLPVNKLSPSISQGQSHSSWHWKTRRRSSFWSVVLITLISLLILVGGRVLFIQIASHIAMTNQNANQTKLNQVAMQLYHQVLSQPPNFHYSLTVPSNDWKLFDAKYLKCSIQSNGLHAWDRNRGDILSCSQEVTRLTDFAFQVDMHILSGGGGLTCRENAFGQYEFLIAPDGTYSIGMQRAAQSIGFQSGKTQAMIAKAGSTNVLTLIGKGSDIYFYVNQTFVTLLQDTNFSFGYVGVVASSDTTSPSEATYTNAQFWNLGK